jgi:hypothetical protein
MEWLEISELASKYEDNLHNAIVTMTNGYELMCKTKSYAFLRHDIELSSSSFHAVILPEKAMRAVCCST